MTLKFNRLLEVVEAYVRAKVQAKCSSSWVINTVLDFGQLLDFDHKYIRNESNNRQAENGVINHDFFPTFDENNWVNFGPLTKK